MNKIEEWDAGELLVSAMRGCTVAELRQLTQAAVLTRDRAQQIGAIGLAGWWHAVGSVAERMLDVAEIESLGDGGVSP